MAVLLSSLLPLCIDGSMFQPSPSRSFSAPLLRDRSTPLPTVPSLITMGSTDAGDIVHRMNQHSSRAEVQVLGCRRLGELAATSEPAVAEGGIEAVVRAMAVHLPCVAVQEGGCLALANLDDLKKGAVAEKGGIEAVVRAMEEHTSSTGVQEAGCVALANLAAKGDIEKSAFGGNRAAIVAKNNRAAIVAKGGVEAVVRGMGVHSSSAAVQEPGCKALANIAVSIHNKAPIAEKGGIEAVVRAMEEHASSAEVQEHGCAALGMLVCENTENQAAVVAKGGIRAVVRAMQAHASSVGVQKQGCRALANLPGCSALGTMSTLQHHIAAAVAAEGGIEVLVAAMGAHSSSAAVQEAGCKALRFLSHTNAADVAAKGGIEAAVRAMEVHSSDAGVQEQACCALNNFAEDAGLPSWVRETGAVPLLEKALSAFPNRELLRDDARLRQLQSLVRSSVVRRSEKAV